MVFTGQYRFRFGITDEPGATKKGQSTLRSAAAWRSQTYKSCSRQSVALTNSSFLLIANPQVASDSMKVEWHGVTGSYQGRSSIFHQANASSDLAVCGESSTQNRWHLPSGYTGERLNSGTLVVVPLNLTSSLLNSISFSVSLAPPQLLSLCWSPG